MSVVFCTTDHSPMTFYLDTLKLLDSALYGDLNFKIIVAFYRV